MPRLQPHLLGSQLEPRIQAILNNRRIPGAAVGIVDDQELVWSSAFGLADLESGSPAKVDTVFRVGSITKTFTTTAILQLRDDGKLELEQPLLAYIPEFSAVQCRFGRVQDVTLLRLLTHHSGLQSETVGRNWETWDSPSVESILDSLPQTQVVIEADSAFKYSNLAFALLGEVVRRTSGKQYTKYVHDEILTPLGMTSSGFSIEDLYASAVAIGYEFSPFSDFPPRAPNKPLSAGDAPGGQLYSSVHDLAKWLAFQLRGTGATAEGNQILTARSLADMHRVRFLESDWKTGYCLAWIARRDGDYISFEHGGTVQGFTSIIRFAPKQKLGFIVLRNSGVGESEILSLMQEVAEQGLAAYVPSLQGRTYLQTPPAFVRLLGRYVTRGGQPLSVVWRDGGLHVYSADTPLAKLQATSSELTFIAVNGRWAGEELRFQSNEEGKITSFLHYETPYWRLFSLSSPDQANPTANAPTGSS